MYSWWIEREEGRTKRGEGYGSGYGCGYGWEKAVEEVCVAGLKVALTQPLRVVAAERQVGTSQQSDCATLIRVVSRDGFMSLWKGSSVSFFSHLSSSLLRQFAFSPLSLSFASVRSCPLPFLFKAENRHIQNYDSNCDSNLRIDSQNDMNEPENEA